MTIAIFLLVFSGCETTVVEPEESAIQEIQNASVEEYLNRQYTYCPFSKDEIKNEIIFTSSHEDIASIDSDGVIIGKKVGITVINAICGDESRAIIFSVKPYEIQLDIEVGENFDPAEIFVDYPQITTYSDLSQTGILREESDNTYTAEYVGSIQIEGYCEDNNIYAIAYITVNNVNNNI
jgi:hypothetical protein